MTLDLPILQESHKVTDPVCGMQIDPDTAAGKYDYKGVTYYFCHASCLERFKADPEKFLSPSNEPAPAAKPGTLYTCPMDPEVKQEAHTHTH